MVVALLIIAALAMMARKRRNEKRHHEAQQIRAEVQEHHQHVGKRDLAAQQTEAGAKAAEAALLRNVASTHRDAVDTLRQEFDERRKLADELSPHTPKARDVQPDGQDDGRQGGFGAGKHEHDRHGVPQQGYPQNSGAALDNGRMATDRLTR
ncbi:MAG: hypothetical protein SV966_16110 [Actinomycetota bacterium]|nr:hypothetical protein [Actinomycetota bacterium]